MKYAHLLTFCLVLCCTGASAEELKSEKDILSYSIGIYLGPQVKQQFGDLNYQMFFVIRLHKVL